MKPFIYICFFALSSLGVFAQESQVKQWTFQECLEYAVEHNISIKNIEYSAETANVTLQQSKDSRLPVVNGSASQAFRNGQSIDPITSEFVDQQINTTSFGVNASVNLFQGNQIKNRIKQNTLLADQNSLYVEEAKNSIKLSVAEAYLQALYAKEGIVVAEKTLEASTKEAEQAKARLDAGSIAMQDYTDAISQEATNRYDLIEAKNNYEQQVIVLKQLLELEPEVEFDIVTPNNDIYTAPILPNKIAVYEAALGMLPEYEAVQLDVDVTEKDLDIAKGDYLPTLALTSSLGTGYTSSQDMNFSNQLNGNFNQTVGLSLTIPIFNGFQTKAEVQKAKIAIDQSKLEVVSLQKEIYKNVATAYQNALSSQEQLEAAKAANKAAEESYKLAQKKYDLGALSTTDLVVSQNAFTNAQLNYLQAKYLNILYNQLLQYYQGNAITL
ncbi:TolC family protein [Tamlana sp. 62-3]|uniref:TolC family protein n=1 Tax=Neotamlana sargassicola TaxID=2883125 RepID=A0A9X1L7L2_9FLAO|nr:TolC family protein [Tamlana sargassicola]MCB4809001.1 TolC family protein [Tamlana sargassicola]